MICDFCKQNKKKVYYDFDRLICNNCLKIYLESLRYKIVNLSSEIRSLRVKFWKDLEREHLKYEVLRGYLKEALPKDEIERISK